MAKLGRWAGVSQEVQCLPIIWQVCSRATGEENAGQTDCFRSRGDFNDYTASSGYVFDVA